MLHEEDQVAADAADAAVPEILESVDREAVIATAFRARAGELLPIAAQLPTHLPGPLRAARLPRQVDQGLCFGREADAHGVASIAAPR